MRKVTTRLAILLLTVSIGIAITNLWAASRSRRAKGVSFPHPVAERAKVAPNPIDGWKKIDIAGRVSFYLPPGMEEIVLANVPEADRAFRRVKTSEHEFLYLNYVYGKRASCDTGAKYPNKEIRHESGVMVGGKEAKLNIWQTGRAKYLTNFSTHPQMTLCFPELDGGKVRLYFYAGARDVKSLEAALQIFDTIEFH